MSKSDDVICTVRHGQQPAELLDVICRLYDVVFSVSPFRWTDDESERHRQSLARLVTNSTFALVTAEICIVLVGFAYGIRLPPQTAWWHGFQEALPAELTTEYEGRTFSLIDLAVDERYRGRGIGRRLIDMLLTTRDEERVTLTAHSELFVDQGR